MQFNGSLCSFNTLDTDIFRDINYRNDTNIYISKKNSGKIIGTKLDMFSSIWQSSSKDNLLS